MIHFNASPDSGREYDETVIDMPVKPDKYVRLTVKKPAGDEEAEITQFPCYIGRAKDKSGLWLNDRSVSRRHAAIGYENGILTVTDTNSGNGVKLDGKRIEPNGKVLIRRGSLLKLGKTEILVAEVFDNAGMRAISPAGIKPDLAPEVKRAKVLNAAKQNTHKAKLRLFCTMCGHKNTEMAKFCINCGAKL